MLRIRLSLAVFCLSVATAFAQPTYQPATGRTLLRAGRALDVHTGKETPDERVIIAGDKIIAIAATSATPAGPGDRVVDPAPGKWADVIAVKGDPLADVKILQHVPFVMKAGVIYKDEAQPAAVDKLAAFAQAHVESNPMENSF